MNLLQMMDAAKAGKLKALYVVGSNPVARYNIDPFVFSKHVRRGAGHVPDRDGAGIAMWSCRSRTPTRSPAPMTNTCGDLQMLKKGGDFAGVRTDFECIVRIANTMGYDVHKLVPFGGARHARRHGTVARRAVGRIRPARGVACVAQSRTQDEPVRSHRHAGRNSAAGAGLRHLAAGHCWQARTSTRNWCRSRARPAPDIRS